MGLKNAFFGVPTTSPVYYVGAISAIILLFILVEAAFRKEMGKILEDCRLVNVLD